MSQRGQPWGFFELGLRECELQVLDPETAFELERPIIDHLGEPLALALAAPDHAASALMRGSKHALGLGEAMAVAPALAARQLAQLGRLVGGALMAAEIDPAWMAETWGRMVLGRLRVNGKLVRHGRAWTALRVSPLAKWAVLGVQLRQTFGPLWTRSPFAMRSKTAESYGVQAPDTPVAVAWANALAKCGSASSSLEVLRDWTPVHMIQIVEEAAADAERHRRAMASKETKKPTRT